MQNTVQQCTLKQSPPLPQPLPEMTTKSALKEAQSLQEEFKTRSIHKAVITADNFDSAMSERNTGHPQRGYGSILPHHSSDHRAM